MMAGKYKIELLPPSFSPLSPKKVRSKDPASRETKQIAVLLSGGVDSSVATHFIKEYGWDVLGITMKMPVSCNSSSRRYCGIDAAFVCNELDIPHYFVNVTEPFEKLILSV